MDVALILDSSGDPEESLSLTRETSRSAAIQSIAEMITENRLWQKIPAATLVVRETPYPLIAVFGQLSAFSRDILTHLAEQLRETLTRHRYIDYLAAERAVEGLARNLVSRFGRDEIARFRFTAFPRGGLIVLGMLSYVLRLSRDQIVGLEHGSDRTLVVVDDCALSGFRFREFLGTMRAQRIVFCPVFAPGQLLRAVERAEPRVVACLTGEELADAEVPQVTEVNRDEPADAARPDKCRPYRTVRPEYIAFAWSEPDTGFWNTETRQTEHGWNVVPPRLCLDRRASSPVRDERVVVVCPPHGVVAPADRVLWAEIDGAIAVARFPDGQAAPGITGGAARCYKLEKSAAIMWRAIAEAGDTDSAEAALRAELDVEPMVLKRDLARFVDELRATGLIRGGTER